MPAAVVATAFGGPEVFELADLDTPAPGIGEVTIAVRSAAVNPSDIKTAAGVFGRNEANLPLRIGAEVSGVISAVGDDAGPFAIGDEVVAYRVRGGWSAEITTAARSVFAKPEGLGFDAAAGLLLVGVTAQHLLTATRVGAGDTVLVHGASGSVGSIATQLARLAGASVIGTTSDGGAEYVRSLGATPVLYGDGLVGRVRALAARVDAALDTVGSDQAIDDSVALVADRSRIATINGFAHGAAAGILLLGGGSGADPGTDIRNAARGPLLELAGDGRVVVRLGPSFALADAREAAELVAGGHPGGKVVLHP
ncbi:zinc-binding alcohol dehydrogenase family protein [Amnibacterium flavum]|uniref:Alcohol dehydrogenase n=1 Tax=Amnibacterium flavum TaxID=2173173 RepID=A0A2V1HPE5_9MICO|nr:NADP-dependent oxidoreductase [Amnibacterium flavum]PVZ94201.1 alcohol dehydrogenase [Amnibacterium flavum]